MTFRSLLIRNCSKLFIVILSALWIVSLPEPEPDSILHYRNALVILVAVVISGKILFDTLFYDRYV